MPAPVFLDRWPRSLAAIGVVLLLAGVGWIDYVTGTEVRLLALYFLPLLLAGWRLGVAGAAVMAALATAVWVGVMAASGTHFEADYVWFVNGTTEGIGFVVVAVLVARLRGSLDRERALSRQDPLTALHNRRALMEDASRALAACVRHVHAVSVICMDLDGFKAANDTHGHHCGDALLQQAAAILGTSTRSMDIVARTGGDEFVIFLPETGSAQADALMRRMRDAIASSASFRSAAVGVSAGVVSEDPARSDLEALLRQADARMYAAKRRAKAGPNANDSEMCPQT